MKAVAARVGRTHANLLHHFGSAAGLQNALITQLADTITARIGTVAKRARAGQADPRDVVDLTFDAFAKGGGAMASWMILSGKHDALDPVLSAIHRLVEDLAEGEAEQGKRVREETLQLVLVALGDALLGTAMTRALGLSGDSARIVATRALVAARAPAAGAGG